MSNENDRDIADLFANRTPPGNDAEFATRVNVKLARRRWAILGIRIALVLGVLVVAAPFLPSFISSLLRSIGLPAP